MYVCDYGCWIGAANRWLCLAPSKIREGSPNGTLLLINIYLLVILFTVINHHVSVACQFAVPMCG